MIGNVILYLVSFILFSWGTAHIVSTGNVVSDFGDLTDAPDEQLQWNGLSKEFC